MRVPYLVPAGLLGAAMLLCVLAMSLLTSPAAQGAGATHPANPPQWGPDIRVNPQTSATPSVQRNFSLAIDPTNPNHVIASYDSQHPPASISGYAWSTDAGRTWAGDLQRGNWMTTTNGLPSGNTSVAFDGQGTAYYTTQGAGDNAAGYFVLTSTLGNAWSTPVPIVISDYSTYRDQAHLAVDQRTSGPWAGSLYVSWRYFTQNFEGLWLRYSRDHGRTWSSDVHISDPDHSYLAGPGLTVASDGSVYAVFENEPRTVSSYYLDRSTDGGATWGVDRLVGGGAITRIGFLDWKGHWPALYGGPNEGIFLINNNPSLAVAPDDPNTVYVVWNDGRWDTQINTSWGQIGQHADIAFTRSTDAGLTWSPLARMNDDPPMNGVDQFQPTVAAGPNGLVSITWYDRRDDPNGFLYKLYHTQSTDGGVTWSPNQPVSDVPSDPLANLSPKGEGYMGEYSALAVGPDYVLPLWIDSRNSGQDVYTDRGVFAPPPTYTPTATATPLATATATPSITPSPSPTLCATTFTDVDPTAYFATPVRWLACRQIVAGYQCGGPGEPCVPPDNRPYFRPYNTTTRGQLSKMVVLGQGWTITTPITPTFADVDTNHPFYPYIETAYAQGVISGYTCGGTGEPCDPTNRPYFRPGAYVTRGQLTKIIVNTRGWGVLLPPTNTFADVPAGDPFFGFIERAVQRGLITGYTCGGTGEPCDPQQRPYFRTGNSATRGQLSKILYTALTQP